MKKSKNLGVSLIELLISMVVFVTCITPIIGQLAAGVRTGQKADDQQAATDYGKSIEESIKQDDLASLIDLENGTVDRQGLCKILSIDNDDNLTVNCSFYSIRKSTDTNGNTIAVPVMGYTLSSLSSTSAISVVKPVDQDGNEISTQKTKSSVTAMYQDVNLRNRSNSAENKEALVRVYSISGTSKIDYRSYNVEITMDTTPYALSSLADATDTSLGYDPNAVNLGNLSSLDKNTTAVITNSSSYDSVVSSAFYNTVLSALEATGGYEDKIDQYKTGNADLSDYTDVTKHIDITIDPVTGDTNYNYEVTCELTYENDDLMKECTSLTKTDVTKEYTIYQQKFKNLPQIYLMYNQFLYMGDYNSDTITITNNLENDELAKVYLIRTSETDSGVNDVVSLNGSSSTSSDSSEAVASSLLPKSGYNRDAMNAGKYIFQTNIILKNYKYKGEQVTKVFTNMPITDNLALASDAANSSKCKVTVDVELDSSKNETVYDYVDFLQNDEQYSESGRVYDVTVKLTNTSSGNETTYGSREAEADNNVEAEGSSSSSEESSDSSSKEGSGSGE